MFAPSATRSQPLPSRADLWVLALLALVTMIVRGLWIGDPNADIDEQLYSLIGNAMLQGQVPFVDLWDRKPIGLFALFALAHAVGGPGPEAYQVLAALFTLAGSYMTHRLARQLVDPVTAAGAGLLYIALISVYGGHSGNSEVFFVPMMLGMALLVRDPGHPQAIGRALAAMLIGGLALQVKYTALPQCLFFGLWALWGQYRKGLALPRLAALAAGFGALGLLPSVMVGTGYALAGYWDAFLFANVISFFDRLPSQAGRFDPGLTLFVTPLAVLTVSGLYASWRMTPPRNPRTYVFIVLWLFASLATVFLPSTIYRYYFAAAVPATVLISLPLLDRKGPVSAVPLVLALIGAGYLLFLPTRYQQMREHRAPMARLTAAIAPRVDADQRCLYIFDGPTALYRLTGSCLPTKFIYPDHLNNALEKTALGIVQADEVARILARRPPVIITADTPFTPQNEDSKRMVDAAVARDYTQIARETLDDRVIRAWARRN